MFASLMSDSAKANFAWRRLYAHATPCFAGFALLFVTLGPFCTRRALDGCLTRRGCSMTQCCVANGFNAVTRR